MHLDEIVAKIFHEMNNNLMKQYDSYQSRYRYQSAGCNSNNSSVSSILKEPGRSKLKHQRSVRFEEPDDYSSNEVSFDMKNSCNPQGKQSPKITPNNSFMINKTPIKPNFSECSPQPSINSKNHRSSKSSVISSQDTYPNSSPIKILSVTRLSQNNYSSNSPKFQPKTLNYDFRDQSFYQKLNRFIKAKESISPIRSTNTSFIQDVKLSKNINEKNIEMNQSYESPINS